MNISSIFLHLFHIIIIGSLLIYVGIKKNTLSPTFYYGLLILGIYVFLYHGFKVYSKIVNKINPWINIIHIAIFSPLLFYIGYNKGNVSNYYYEILLMIGFAVVGYHSYYLLLGN